MVMHVQFLPLSKNLIRQVILATIICNDTSCLSGRLELKARHLRTRGLEGGSTPPSRFWALAASTDVGLISGVQIDAGISAGRADLGFTDVQMAVNPHGKSSTKQDASYAVV